MASLAVKKTSTETYGSSMVNESPKPILANQNTVTTVDSEGGKVVKFYRAANDNDPSQIKNVQKTGYINNSFDKLRRTRIKKRQNQNIPPSEKRSVHQKSRAERMLAIRNGRAVKGVTKTAKSAAATSAIVEVTIIVYLWQLAFAVLAIIGLGLATANADSWLITIATFGLGGIGGKTIMAVGLVTTLLLGAVSFLIAIGIYMSRRINCWRGLSIPLIALGLCCYITPFLNLLPIMWLWCLYVLKSQAESIIQ